jgi:hypothetical protein
MRIIGRRGSHAPAEGLRVTFNSEATKELDGTKKIKKKSKLYCQATITLLSSDNYI